MALINFPIGPRSHELIRNQVGAILADEMLNQYAITYDDLFDVAVYVQRTKPIMPDELTVINVSLDGGSFDNQTAEKSDGSFEVYIDVYCSGSDDDSNPGDVNSAFNAHRIAGVCMGILESPIYMTLGFEAPFIMYSEVTGFAEAEPDRSDSTNMTRVRVTLSVHASQNEQLSPANQIQGNTTTVTLSNGPNGFVYVLNI